MKIEKIAEKMSPIEFQNFLEASTFATTPIQTCWFVDRTRKNEKKFIRDHNNIKVTQFTEKHPQPPHVGWTCGGV